MVLPGVSDFHSERVNIPIEFDVMTFIEKNWKCTADSHEIWRNFRSFSIVELWFDQFVDYCHKFRTGKQWHLCNVHLCVSVIRFVPICQQIFGTNNCEHNTIFHGRNHWQWTESPIEYWEKSLFEWRMHQTTQWNYQSRKGQIPSCDCGWWRMLRIPIQIRIGHENQRWRFDIWTVGRESSGGRYSFYGILCRCHHWLSHRIDKIGISHHG